MLFLSVSFWYHALGRLGVIPALCFLAGGAQSAYAQQASLSMPFGVLPSGQDRIRSADGVECQTHVGPRNRWMDMGVYSMGNQTNNLPSVPNSSQAVGVYARITINLDRVAPQIDCSRLYQLEIDRLRREIDDQQMNSKVSVQPR